MQSVYYTFVVYVFYFYFTAPPNAAGHAGGSSSQVGPPGSVPGAIGLLQAQAPLQQPAPDLPSMKFRFICVARFNDYFALFSVVLFTYKFKK